MLLRHGESEWNAKNLFTGWANPELTEAGERDAVRAGQLIGGHGVLPGLWPIHGDGVLARQGDLVLLIHPAGGAFTDRLLDLLAGAALELVPSDEVAAVGVVFIAANSG